MGKPCPTVLELRQVCLGYELRLGIQDLELAPLSRRQGGLGVRVLASSALVEPVSLVLLPDAGRHPDAAGDFLETTVELVV